MAAESLPQESIARFRCKGCGTYLYPSQVSGDGHTVTDGAGNPVPCGPVVQVYCPRCEGAPWTYEHLCLPCRRVIDESDPEAETADDTIDGMLICRCMGDCGDDDSGTPVQEVDRG